jgi:hypothetical protein
LLFVTKAATDWANSGQDICESFHELFDIIVGWKLPSDDDDAAFDVLKPQARFCECSPEEASTNLKKNLYEKVLAPIIDKGFAGLTKLMNVLNQIIVGVNDAVDVAPEDFDNTLETVLRVCRGAAYIATRKRDPLGGTIANFQFMEALANKDSAGMPLLYTIRQNEFFNSMYNEVKACEAFLVQSGDKVVDWETKLAKANSNKESMSSADLVAASHLCAEAAIGMRPTQATALKELIAEASGYYEAAVMTKLSAGEREEKDLTEYENYCSN